MASPFLLLCGLCLIMMEVLHYFLLLPGLYWVSCQKNKRKGKDRKCILLASLDLIHACLLGPMTDQFMSPSGSQVPIHYLIKAFLGLIKITKVWQIPPLGLLLLSVITTSSRQFMSTESISPKPCPKAGSENPGSTSGALIVRKPSPKTEAMRRAETHKCN